MLIICYSILAMPLLAEERTKAEISHGLDVFHRLRIHVRTSGAIVLNVDALRTLIDPISNRLEIGLVDGELICVRVLTGILAAVLTQESLCLLRVG